jgi:hypothetical protein
MTTRLRRQLPAWVLPVTGWVKGGSIGAPQRIFRLLAAGAFVLSAAAALLLGAASWPGRQAATGPLVGAEGSCRNNALVRLPGLAADRLDKGIGFTYALEGGSLLTRDEAGARALNRLLQPLDRLVVFLRSPASDKYFVRHIRDGLPACGWIAARYVLTSRDVGAAGLAYGPLPLPAVANGPPPPLGLALRAVIATRNAPLYMEPGGEPRPQISFTDSDASTFHVFRVSPHVASAGGVPQRWYLLGVRDIETVLLGWVRSDDATLAETALLPGRPRAMPVGQPPRRDAKMPAHKDEPMIAVEAPAARWLASLARDLCAEAANDDALALLWRGIQTRIDLGRPHGLGSSAALLMSMFGLPRDVIPGVYFASWDELETRHRHLTKIERDALKARVCAKAKMLLDARDKLPERAALGLTLVKIPLSVLK